MSTCKYCNKPENKQEDPGLVCQTCSHFIHLTCLRRPGTPGDFACDVFFDFTCIDCCASGEELFERKKFPWVNVILLTLHHLNTHAFAISNRGYFHYKTHICSFIDRYWTQLFGPQCKQKKNWVGTIAGVLSVYNQLLFRSGSSVLGESGWWKLQHAFSPAVAAHIVQEMARDKTKGKPRNLLSSEKNLFFRIVKIMGYEHLIVVNKEAPMNSPVKKSAQRLQLKSEGETSAESQSFELEPKPQTYTCVTAKDNCSDVETMFHGFEFQFSSDYMQAEDIKEDAQSPFAQDSDSRSSTHQNNSDDNDRPEEKKSKKHTEPKEKQVYPRESLFSTELNSVDMPWFEKPPEIRKDLIEMSEYEEIQMLKQVEALIPRMRDVNKKTYLARLRANLALRRLKRHKHLPLFNLDKMVKLLGGYVAEDPLVMANAERVLDRFQRSYVMDNLSGTIASTNYGTLLVSAGERAPFRSPYSGTTLKPYIWRDAHTTPTWLKLTDELLRRTNRHTKQYRPPPRATIDYSYVGPHHIAAVNNLCAQYFWPGIDLSEALQHPEFSCVVTYKKLVVGCAFLVPDAKPHEAYISFVVTRPEWRKAKIATFMLYHLLQTCTGKDVTLHVSPTNPAIFLYQKFGFKVEELIQDFYEKYYDIDYKGCRHALFLRLVR